ncbi:hypothetical protein [Streptomyces sp. NPDC002133]|uniref:hypothetical protein n=1 Tax=Streptomyces sp. NPDC002133 TaxID=3154409 RepID=UPI00331CC954
MTQPVGVLPTGRPGRPAYCRQFEGANALAASSNDAEAFTDARRAAETLLDAALRTAPGVRAAVDGHDLPEHRQNAERDADLDRNRDSAF